MIFKCTDSRNFARSVAVFSSFALATILGSFAFGQADRPLINDIDLAGASKLLTCSPPLISHRINERGFAAEVSTKYGEFEFSRNDVGDPDGELSLRQKSVEICRLPLSLTSGIYFSAKLGIMALRSQSGSNSWFDLYRVAQGKCELLGRTTANSKAIEDLFSEHDGQRVCR